MARLPAAGDGVGGARGIIVCADDFAVNQSASLGIAKLAGMGRLSATSVMVLSPRWAQDVALLHELRGQIDVGLHLDWTSAFAMAAGHGLPLGRAMRRALLGGFDAMQARAVIERQLEVFETLWQAPPHFVDGHQHVQQFAGIREALVAVLVRRYGTHAVRPYLRISRAPPGMADLKSRVIAGMGASALESIAASAGLIRARGLFGIYN
ncbi:MAG: ChbG/HpnK family deacetylase, partial [Rhodoferax sp.]|nr:ChbG/HpnK family deacetylase [Rhodoferax sp.]